MKGLLLMDFKFLKRQRKFLMVVSLLVLVFLFQEEMSSFGVSYATMLFGFFAVNSIYYDEANNGNPFLFTLPFSRKEYVISKYLFGFIMGGCAWVISSLLGIIFLSVSGSSVNTGEWLATGFISLILLLIMFSIMLPIQFKFGMEKGRIATIIFFVAIFVLLYSFGGEEHTKTIQAVVTFLNGINPAALLLGASLVAVALTAVSMVSSTCIIQKKEF